MKIQTCLLAAVLLMTLAVLGCNGEEEEAGPTATPPEVTDTASPGTTPAELTPVSTPETAAEETPVEGSAIAVDAVPGGPVDAERRVSGAAPFQVEIVVTAAPNAYKAFQYTLQWDPGVLAYRALEYPRPGPGGLDVCPPPVTTESTVYGGCAGFEATEFVGPVSTVTFECVSTGTSPLHLETIAEEPSFGSAMAHAPGQPFDTMLTDASITCE